MNLRLLASALALVVASQSLTGCFFFWDRSEPAPVAPLAPPTEENPSFQFLSSRGCGPLLGNQCPLTRPLMAGVNEQVMVYLPHAAAGRVPAVTSSDAAIVTVEPIAPTSASGADFLGSFRVRAGSRPGSAVLTVSDADGVETTTTVRVDEAAGMDLVEDEGTARYDRGSDRITLRVGERVSMNGYPVNREGVRLYANDGVVWTVASAERVSLSWSVMSGERVADDHVYVTARAPGTEVVTVRAGVVERSLTVEVR
jgi:hypothetical protein